MTRQRLLFFLALAALMAIFAGCKGESPTAPPPVGTPNNGGTGGTGQGGGVTPPVGATLTVTVSNPTPLVNSISTITATVTANGQPVANGTAVEFITSAGTFTDTQDVRTIRTTTNGVASAVLTASEATTAVVSVGVNNVAKTVQITFSEVVTPPPPPSTAPTITGVTPTTGPPAGGTIITITGTNFRAPARVVVDAGPAGVKEAVVQSVTPTQIVAVVQGITLSTTQSQAASVTVIVDAGNPGEQRVTRAGAFTFVNPAGTLTPVIRAISPTSGPIDGGTRVTITGDAFDATGVQVFFNNAQAQVISVNFNQIIVIAPTARDTASNGSGAVTGPVDIRVLNVTSGKSVTAAGGFRYTPKVQVTLVGPNEGPFTGGTRFTIDGVGFNEPLSVTLAGVAAQVIKVTGTQIIGISSPVQITGCADVSGPIVVTNGDNGDTGTGPTWFYRVLKPAVVGVRSSSGGLIFPGSNVAVTVINAGAFPSLTIGSAVVPVTSVTQNSDGTTTLTAVVPVNTTLLTAACSGGGAVTSPQPTPLNIVVTNLESGCTTTLANGITVNPPPIGRMFLSPNPLTVTARAATPGDPTATPPVPPTPAQPGTGTFTITNNGAAPLTITSVVSGNPAVYTITSDPTGQTIPVCDSALVSVRYGPEAPGATSATQITITATTGTPTQNLTARETVNGSTQ